MPKCKECGFESSRLQWTHFKYKCTGKFNNGKEYQAAYPGALLVDPELAKRTRVTKDNLIAKYGAEEGLERWQQYKQKQAYSNSFECKQERYGWTKSEFDNFNKSRAVTLDSMIQQHGEADGAVRWQAYCARQAYTNTLAYFVEQYGEEEGAIKYRDINQLKSHSVESLMKRHNCGIDEALAISSTMHGNRNSVSALEESFCLKLEEVLATELDYSCSTKQYAVWSTAERKLYFYDVVHNNRCIEFNGDYWHSNPALYNATYYNRQTDTIASDKWVQDQNKIDAL